MDNFDLVNFEGSGDVPVNPDLDKPIPFDDSDPGPAATSNGVSRQPLTLGGSAASPAAKPAAQPAPKPAPAPKPQPVAAKPTPPTPSAPAPVSASPGPISGVDMRIRGVKTFFTKLHPGAIVFLDEQVQNWLNEHPEITIKRTNITTGEVQAKKTEPNLIVMVWY